MVDRFDCIPGQYTYGMVIETMDKVSDQRIIAVKQADGQVRKPGSSPMGVCNSKTQEVRKHGHKVKPVPLLFT
jgi:hypothetical protein